MQVYLSGPITGHEDTYKQAFNHAAEVVRTAGHTPINPVDLDAQSSRPHWASNIARDVALLIEGRATAIAMLPGWEGSRGARLELAVALEKYLDVYLIEAAPAQEWVLVAIIPSRAHRLLEDAEEAALESVRQQLAEVEVEDDPTNDDDYLRSLEGERRSDDYVEGERGFGLAYAQAVDGFEARFWKGESSEQVTVEDIEAHFGVGGEQRAQGPVRQFTTGANRDVADHKHDYEGFLSPRVIRRFGAYMHRHRFLRDGSVRASDNWQKGMPPDVYMKSGWRHFMDWWTLHRQVETLDFEGQPVDIENALCALLFNVQGYLDTVLRGREESSQDGIGGAQ